MPTDNLLNRLHRIHAAMGATVERDLAKFPPNVVSDEHGFRMYQDFMGGLTEPQITNLAHGLIHNIANVPDHLRRWCKKTGHNAQRIDQLIRGCFPLQISTATKQRLAEAGEDWKRKRADFLATFVGSEEEKVAALIKNVGFPPNSGVYPKSSWWLLFDVRMKNTGYVTIREFASHTAVFGNEYLQTAVSGLSNELDDRIQHCVLDGEGDDRVSLFPGGQRSLPAPRLLVPTTIALSNVALSFRCRVYVVYCRAMKETAKRYLWTCLRCGHQWLSQSEHPSRCSNQACRSPYWDRPRKNQTAEKVA